VIEINLAFGAESRRAPRARAASLRLPAVPALGSDPRIGGAAVAGVLLVLFVGHAFWSQGSRRAELEAQLREQVQDSTRYATTISLVRALEARQDTIRQKIGVIREVDQRRYVWPHLLDEISAAVPSYTWLRSITSTEPDTLHTVPSVTLQGNAGSTQALTRFMKNLESSPYVRDVTLVTSEQVEVDGRAVHKFTLEARYEAPDSTAILTVPLVTLD
jgi:Tfp pilus assembly protein PilN